MKWLLVILIQPSPKSEKVVRWHAERFNTKAECVLAGKKTENRQGVKFVCERI